MELADAKRACIVLVQVAPIDDDACFSLCIAFLKLQSSRSDTTVRLSLNFYSVVTPGVVN